MDNSDNEERDELRMYFDSEVNRILSKIKNSKITDKDIPTCEMDIGKNKKLMNCKNVFKKDSQKLINNYKNNILKESFKDSLSSTKLTQKKSQN